MSRRANDRQGQGKGLTLFHAPRPTPHAPTLTFFSVRERGIALLIVVSLLTVIGIIGVAFAFSMRLETQATRQFVSVTQARYLAEAGVSHARAVLDDDRLGSRVDSLDEAWVKDVSGNDVDVDGDGKADARWWPVADGRQQTIGRYAVKVMDEAGKANLNAALAEPSPLGVGAVNLTTLLKQIGFDDTRAHQAAVAIEQYRYGPDGRPGKAGVDDDGDGAIDNVEEYQPLALRGDDRRLESLEQLVAIAGLTPDEVHRLSQVATVYSWDVNVSVTGKPRVNVNTATANELVAILLEAGVTNPWQVAANMADYVDRDVEMSRVTKSSQLLSITNQGSLGSWAWSDDPEGHYASNAPGGAALSWTIPVPTGKFRLLVHGLNGMKVGDVTVAGQSKPSVNDGESLGIFTLSGTLEVSVNNREPAGTRCAFEGIELVSEGAQGGIVVRGIEAVRFNELMIEPVMPFDVTSCSPSSATCKFSGSGSDWGRTVGTDYYVNGGVGQATWTWSSSLQPGRYYVRVFAISPGQTVGDVRVDGQSQRLVHGQTHPSPVTVGSDGKVSVTIGKTDANGTYYLKSIALSLQPDGEYVELINLSNDPIDISGWTIDGEATAGRQARFPSGSVIKSHSVLVAAVDLDDTQTTLAANGIDARSAWGISREANAVQLEFPSGAPSPDDDWLKVTLPAGSPARLVLHSKEGLVVDEVEYPLPLPTTSPFQSLEKGDPTVIVDKNQNGIDEGWYPSLKLYTPGMSNDNDGLREQRGLETIVHDPSKEITILNRPIQGIGELAGLPSGKPWKPFSSEDLAKIVDRLTVEGHRLEAEGHLIEELSGQRAWEEKAEGYYLHTDPQQSDAIGRWQWTEIPDGRYRLSLYGCPGCMGEQLSVRWKRRDGTVTDWSAPLSTDAQGRIVIGQITIGLPGGSSALPETDGTPANTLSLEVRCVSQSGICHFDYVELDPQLIRIGPVNVNTAPLEVLLSLPGMTDALASRILAGRPYGDKDQKGWGIGDLLIGDVLGADEESKLQVFKRLAHLFTTRSDVFQILSLGQAMNGDRAEATQRIQTIVQR